VDAALLRYFSAEKQESLLFLAAGMLAFAVSAWLVAIGHPYRGMAVPLVAIGIIQLVVGGTVYARTDAQVAALRAELGANPARFKAAELVRMTRVIGAFTVYKTIEIAILAGGIALTLLFRHRAFLYAAGIGAIAQASLMLVLDLFAEKRADVYVDAIRRLL
jgi:hypothetical protein